MYRRAVLSLYRGGVSCRGFTGHRFVDLVCRRLSVGNVLWSEKSPPENKGTGKPSAEAEDKTPHKEESSKPPEPDALAALLSGMKVEVTSKKKFQAIKKKNPKLQSQENADNIESASRMFQMVAEESHPEEKPVNKELSDAASAVASTYPSQQKQVESELLQQLRLHKQMAEEIRRKGSDNISKVISGMKVKKQSPKTGKQMSAEEREFMRNASKNALQMSSSSSSIIINHHHHHRGSQSKFPISMSLECGRNRRKPAQARREHTATKKQCSPLSHHASTNYCGSSSDTKHQEFNDKMLSTCSQYQMVLTAYRLGSLHTGKRLRIFPVSAPTEALVGTEMPPTLWDLELVKEIAYIFEHPPRNGFEEMIQWTKEGKLWSFPIDNEAGLDEEQKVEFHEHIFLENYLEDFPKHGPIRHFMELVICGLSKNPYLTVQQKKDHIDWFHDYFHKKEDLLRECDVYIN